MIIAVLAVSLTLILGMVCSIFAQTSGWTTHTANNCKLSIDYPSNWLVQEKQGRLDTSAEGELKISNNNPTMHNLPYLVFTACVELIDNQTSLVETTNTLQNEMATDNSYTIVDYSHLEKNLISGHDAGVFAVMSENIGVELYNVINGTILYQFAYFDMADHFDSIESKNIRDKMLASIKFLS